MPVDNSDKDIIEDFRAFHGTCKEDIGLRSFQCRCNYYLSFLKSNTGYDRIHEQTRNCIHAAIEFLKENGVCTNEVEQKLIEFANLDIEKEIAKMSSIIPSSRGLNKLLICSEKHVNIGNVRTCTTCGKQLRKSCRTKCRSSICQHTACTYEENCHKIDIFPLHQLVVLQFLSGDIHDSGFLSREEHANAIRHDLDNDVLSSHVSRNNEYCLQYLNEDELRALFKARPRKSSSMETPVERESVLSIPLYSCTYYCIVQFLAGYNDDMNEYIHKCYSEFLRTDKWPLRKRGKDAHIPSNYSYFSSL